MPDTLFPVDLPPAGTAVFSPCKKYRYTLTRHWEIQPGPMATFIMLNPSTADATLNDPTVTRCINFARSWGCHGLHVLNVYALRSTDPKGLWQVTDPVGPENDQYLTAHAIEASEHGWPLIAAWGVNAEHARITTVQALDGMGVLQALGLAKSGAPRHPLYLRSDVALIPWPSPKESSSR